jgi:HD superfamily phosphohydrolase
MNQSTKTIREWIDSMPEDVDHMHDLVICGGQMYRIIVEQIDADKMDYSVRDFILKINLGK